VFICVKKPYFYLEGLIYKKNLADSLAKFSRSLVFSSTRQYFTLFNESNKLKCNLMTSNKISQYKTIIDLSNYVVFRYLALSLLMINFVLAQTISNFGLENGEI